MRARVSKRTLKIFRKQKKTFLNQCLQCLISGTDYKDPFLADAVLFIEDSFMKSSIVRVDTSSNIASRITIVVIAVLKCVHCFVFSGFGEDSVKDMKKRLNHR